MARKLVRDNIRGMPGFIPCSSDTWRPVRDSDEHEALLIKKLHEELGELLEAAQVGYSGEVNEEGCDLFEALLCFLVIRTGISQEQIFNRVAQKRVERGSFLGGLVWEHP